LRFTTGLTQDAAQYSEQARYTSKLSLTQATEPSGLLLEHVPHGVEFVIFAPGCDRAVFAGGIEKPPHASPYVSASNSKAGRLSVPLEVH